MATLADIRTFLETNQAQFTEHVAKDMGATKAQQFADELHALQSTWQQNLPEATVVSMTLEQMKGYPPVWDDMQKAGLTAATPPSTAAQPSQASPSPQATTQPAAPAATKPAQPTPPTAQPAQVASQNQATAASSGRPASSGDQTMQQEPLPASTSERLAVWDKKVAIGKEIVTGCLGILIVGMTLLVAFTALLVGIVQPDAWSMAKDVLLVLTGLVGVVLGYYFGRIPADARTDKAEEKAETAKTALDSTKAEVRSILMPPSGADNRSGEEPPALQISSEQRRRLEQLLGP